jgi:hypothetical protein
VDHWAVLKEAERRLIDAFAADGVVRVEYVVGFVKPYGVSVWLGTQTDAQRDALAPHDGLEKRVGEMLETCGIAETDAGFEGVAVQSQETVDRECEGSWFYALR